MPRGDPICGYNRRGPPQRWHAIGMRLKLGIWSALAVGIFAALLTVVPVVLKAAHLHWPAWPLAVSGAVVTWLAV